MKEETLLVVKIGGNVLDDEAALAEFLLDFSNLPGPKMLVHGGGKIATRIGVQLGIEPNYVNGRRITDSATLDLVTMVYGGLLNRQLTARLQALGCNALGMAGADANIFAATRRPVGAVDYGWAGDLTAEQVNADLLFRLLEMGLVPVIAPLTHDGQGHLLNTNADTIAAMTASALAKFYNTRLLYCFEHRGILQDLNDPDSRVVALNQADYQRLQAQAAVGGGILPKLDNAFAAAGAGVQRVVIGHAKDLRANAGESEIFGTLITF